MSIKTVLFGKVDLDTMATALVMGVDPLRQMFRCVAGSASRDDLSDSSTLCIEVGGSGRVKENNFDHHYGAEVVLEKISLSAAAQALERMARLIRYVDELDRGERHASEEDSRKERIFPSLAFLVASMLFSVKDPEEQMEQGLEILREVLHSGIDPYGSMEQILDAIPDAREWVRQKRMHELLTEEVCASAVWHTTKAGRKLAIVVTEWRGAPGALYGRGADVVVALNPRHDERGKVYRKFSVAGAKGVVVTPALERISELEDGWGGPAHGTIIGSPMGESSLLPLEMVVEAVMATL